MAAVTPNVAQHAKLPPMASRFVDVAALPWQKTIYQGVEAKTLLLERDSGLLTVLLKMAPGAKLPDHEHVLIEQTWMLELSGCSKRNPSVRRDSTMLFHVCHPFLLRLRQKESSSAEGPRIFCRHW